MTQLERFARLAYNSYGGYVDWTAVSGAPMPQWEELPDKIRNAWVVATTSTVYQLQQRLFHVLLGQDSP